MMMMMSRRQVMTSYGSSSHPSNHVIGPSRLLRLTAAIILRWKPDANEFDNVFVVVYTWFILARINVTCRAKISRKQLRERWWYCSQQLKHANLNITCAATVAPVCVHTAQWL